MTLWRIAGGAMIRLEVVSLGKYQSFATVVEIEIVFFFTWNE